MIDDDEAILASEISSSQTTMTGKESAWHDPSRSIFKTRVVPIDVSNIGRFVFNASNETYLDGWSLEMSKTIDAINLQEAAEELRVSDVPVAFPTETVYGLGADATRSAAIRGIYHAKQRPSDNPLIVHVSSLAHLRHLFGFGSRVDPTSDPIPPIYLPLIYRFWPGPLTILMPLPSQSPFAPEVTNNLPTVGVRMPSSLHALALIHMAGIPLAAPSANTSSKPSPTTAAHVMHDLDGHINTIIDGGPCEIGVESTVVDGLSDPPVVLRPGSISLEMLRSCQGWQRVNAAHADASDIVLPKAPGMKYKHYSPRAPVVLVQGRLDMQIIKATATSGHSVGILPTKTWSTSDVIFDRADSQVGQSDSDMHEKVRVTTLTTEDVESDDVKQHPAHITPSHQVRSDIAANKMITHIWIMPLGNDTVTIARNLFSGLRAMDEKGVSVIYVEAIDDSEGHLAAAIMNRLQKAAEVQMKNVID